MEKRYRKRNKKLTREIREEIVLHVHEKQPTLLLQQQWQLQQQKLQTERQQDTENKRESNNPR